MNTPTSHGRSNGFGRPVAPGETTLDRLSTKQPAQPSSSVDPQPEKQQPEKYQPRVARHRLEDVVLNAAIKAQVSALVSLIHNYDILYGEWGLGEVDRDGRRMGINFYGMPGTGKTMLADALAHRLGKSIIEINYAELESKYVGETGKNIEAAFNRAKETDSLLFFDEADSVLGRRMTNVTQAADHGVNVARAIMLKQMDGFGGVIVFATNLAKNFDGAFVRRILRHVEVELPDQECRRILWQQKMPPRVPGRDALNWDALAASSEGLSGGEIKNAVINCLSDAVGKVGIDRCVTQKSLETSIAEVRKAKRDVGRYDYSAEA